MARTAHGYKLRWRGDARGWYVRFTIRGQRNDTPTGVKERKAKSTAEAAARELYAAAIRGERRQRAETKPTSEEDLVEVTKQWLLSLAVRPITRDLYRKYAGYWVDRWATLDDLTPGVLAAYSRERLRQVRGKSAANEISALRRMLAWCVECGLLQQAPEVPRVSKSGGTPYKERRRTAAPALTPDEIWAVLNALPERSGRKGWPVRARAIVAYTTTLRPATLEQLRVPEHYAKGGATITITDSIDKEGYAREVPLSRVAREALDSVCPDVGLIFGKHHLNYYLAEAARKVLPADKAAVFTAQHFRSAGITHTLEATSNLPGAQYLAGHKLASTTSRYVRASFRAALEVTKIWDQSSAIVEPNVEPKNKEVRQVADFTSAFRAPRVGLEGTADSENSEKQPLQTTRMLKKTH